MSGASPLAIPAPLQEFTALFNSGAFWESHEVLEGPWRDQGSSFYQGLILYASAFVHLQRDNSHGIQAQLRKARAALGPYEEVYLGVDVATLRREAALIIAAVEALGQPPPGHLVEEITPPQIHLSRQRIRGWEPELGPERG